MYKDGLELVRHRLGCKMDKVRTVGGPSALLLLPAVPHV